MKIIMKVTVLCVLGQLAFNGSSAQDNSDGDFRTITRIISDCMNKQDTSVCFKMQAVKFMDRLNKSPADVPVNEYMTLARSGASIPDSNMTESDVLTEEELEASLPRQLDEKNSRLDVIMWDKFKTLLTTRTFQIHAPIEGRGKDKGLKGKGAMMMMMGGMVMKVMMAGVTMMSMKAMMMAKAALILAGIVALKKLSGGGGGGDSHPQVVYATAEHIPAVSVGSYHGAVSAHGANDAGAGGGGYYRRHHNADGHHLAYGSHSADY